MLTPLLRWSCLTTALLAHLCTAVTSSAAIIPGGSIDFKNVDAIQDVEILPGTFLNPGTSSLVFEEFTANGQFSALRSDQPSMNAPIPFSSTGAFFSTPNSPFGPVELFGTNVYTGEISNIVQDPNIDSPEGFISGVWTSSDVLFGLRILATGLELYTKDAVTFTGTLTDIVMPPPGTLLTSLDPVNIFAIDPGSQQEVLVGISRNRLLLVVPEPSSFVISGVLIALFGVSYSLRRKSSLRTAQ